MPETITLRERVWGHGRNATSAGATRSPVALLDEEVRRSFQDLDRLLLLAVLLAQPAQFVALGAGQLARGAFPRSALARRYQPRKDSEPMPDSRATAVTVYPEESTSAIVSRLNSSVSRFVYLFPTWCYFLFLWNLRSRSPGVQDQGEA
ncbi:hypothetical protein [Streptomyces sp. ATexAB-D23]|nr:hypothetical protein [Streptomyces sp. ATexAB-D23]